MGSSMTRQLSVNVLLSPQSYTLQYFSQNEIQVIVKVPKTSSDGETPKPGTDSKG